MAILLKNKEVDDLGERIFDHMIELYNQVEECKEELTEHQSFANAFLDDYEATNVNIFLPFYIKEFDVEEHLADIYSLVQRLQSGVRQYKALFEQLAQDYN